MKPALLLLLLTGAVDAAPVGWLPDQVFSDYSPLAAKAEFVPRVLPPTEADRFFRFERAAGHEAAEQSVQLAEEKFDLFVPERAPPGGYGLLVFVSPIERFPLAPEWKRELSRRGIIHVAAQRSGNKQNVLDRRIPLALHAYEHVRRHYPLDPARVFVSGFSGGSRVAQRLALAYPDLFQGVMLIGGADAFGEADSRPSRLPGFDRFRRHTRVVFATGGEDLPNRAKDQRAIESFEQQCVSQIRVIWVPRIGHWVPDRRRLAQALDALERPAQSAPAIDTCIAQRQAEVEAELAAIESLLGAGDALQAGERLGRLEQFYGGLAAPHSIDLARRIAERLPIMTPSVPND